MTYYREEQLKAGSRTKKVELIIGINLDGKIGMLNYKNVIVNSSFIM